MLVPGDSKDMAFRKNLGVSLGREIQEGGGIQEGRDIQVGRDILEDGDILEGRDIQEGRDIREGRDTQEETALADSHLAGIMNARPSVVIKSSTFPPHVALY